GPAQPQGARGAPARIHRVRARLPDQRGLREQPGPSQGASGRPGRRPDRRGAADHPGRGRYGPREPAAHPVRLPEGGCAHPCRARGEAVLDGQRRTSGPGRTLGGARPDGHPSAGGAGLRLHDGTGADRGGRRSLLHRVPGDASDRAAAAGREGPAMTLTSTMIAGVLLGLLLGTGLTLLVWQLPWLRPRDLAARVDPYLRRSPSSSLFAAPSSAGRARTVLENLMGPVAQRGMSVLERLTGGPEQLERRLRLAGRRTSIDSFRVEQVVFGAAGLVLGVLAAIAAVGRRDSSVLLGLVLVVLGAVCGVLLRDYLLGVEIKRRAARMAREFPTVAD